MKIWKKSDNRAAADDMVVGNLSHLSAQKPILIAACVAVVAVSGLVWWRVNAHYAQANASANAEMQKALAQELAMASRSSDDRAIITDATQLIDGANDGRFVIGQDKLGWYYTDRGNAYIDQKQYAKAAADFEKSAELNSSLKATALQGEFEARYKTGERKQLIPLLQILVTLERKSQSPVRGSLVNQYQDYIRALQQGKDISI